MTHPIPLLILGGTSEALALARTLDGRFAPILSLAGRTARPTLPQIAHRIGGFGGADGLTTWIAAHGIRIVVDATHPYATRISANAVSASRANGCTLLRLARSPWISAPGDRWTMVPTLSDAASALGTTPRRVLLTVGRQDLDAFRHASLHHYIVRSVDPPDPAALPPGAKIIVARGPFEHDAELDLLRRERIEVIVCKNSGGQAVRAKLDAARALGIAVVMLDRPPPPDDPAPTVTSVAETVRWLHDATAAERGV